MPMEVAQKGPGFQRSIGDDMDVWVVEEKGVLTLETQGRRGFGADDRAAFACKIGQSPDILQCGLPGMLDIAHAECRHS